MKSQEEKNKKINDLENNFIDFAVRRNYKNLDQEKEIIKVIADIARGNKNYPITLNNQMSINHMHTANHFLRDLILRYNNVFQWTEDDELIKGYITKESLAQQHSYSQWNFVRNRLCVPIDTPGVDKFIKYLYKLEVNDEELVKKVGSFFNIAFVCRGGDNKIVETYFANYIKPKLEDKSSLLGLKKTKGLGSILDKLVLENENRNNSHIILRYLMENCPDCIVNFDKYVTIKNHSGIILYPRGVQELLDIDSNKFEKFVLNLTTTFTSEKDKFSIYLLLAEKFPKKYHNEITTFGEKTLNKFCSTVVDKNTRCNYGYIFRGSSDVVYANYLLQNDKDLAIIRLKDYTNDSAYINGRLLNEVESKIGEESLPLLLNGLHKEYNIVDKRWQNYFGNIFKLLEKYDLTSHTEDIIKFGVEKTPKKYRELASKALKKYIELVTPRALELLEGKVNDRVFGAMILQYSEDPTIREKLITLIDTERSDDTRDIMLDALSDIKFTQPLSISEVDDMILKADDRKKLNKWGEKWIEEESLPKLYWNNGNVLTQKEIRFLFYRSKRVKDISSDIEARQVIGLLDQKKSEKFALALIKAYQDSNADSKFKYYLVMSGLIGKDNVLNRLHTVFNSTVTSKRYRMAAMIVGAIAMVGSDKALRIVDMIARKFANKRPQIARGAKEALDAAASELNISMDQLADRIIPDLGFEEHYFTFNAGEEEYRAFINKEFKLNYFNEDNKLRKSIPKDTSREIKAKLKAIEKDIKEVVKAQKGRLENYLITERTWETEEWMEYYVSNPIMLIYVQRLLWGVYDENHQLLTAFHCDDDLEFYDVDDEEVDIENGNYIKILHPLHMNSELLQKWKNKVYVMDKEFEFEIINRNVTIVPEEESERNVTKILYGEDIPKGADFVAGFLLKKGWIKTNGSGGYLEFNKINEMDNTNAHANIEGPAAYYQGGEAPAKIFEIYFNSYKSRERKALKDVQKVFFSEVIADLQALINA